MTASHYIAFPALGWEFPLNNILAQFDLFGHTFTIRWYGALIAIGFLLAVLYGYRRAKHFGINADAMTDVILITTILAFIGARLYYVLFCDDLSGYLSDPLRILRIWEGGLGIYGAVIVAFVAGFFLSKRKKIDPLAMFDLASLGFLIGQACGRWGNFFNQEAFGGNTTLPWGMTGDMIKAGIHGSGYDLTLPVHPTFLYESLWCILGFILLHILSEKAYKFHGQIFFGYIIWYGVGRFFIEHLRTDSLMIGPFKTSQLVAVIAVVGAVVGYILLRRRAANAPLVTEPAPAEATEEKPTAEEPAAEIPTEGLKNTEEGDDNGDTH